jgi:hypothetical protein
MVSFGDTMTALLAFFIVLNSLANEQTGAMLYSGTGSFISNSESFGLPGIFGKKRTKQSFQLEETAPLYVVGDDQPSVPGKNSGGPDDVSDYARIIDRDHEQYQRFVAELKRQGELARQQEIAGEFSIDVMERLPADLSVLTPQHIEVVRTIAPLLLRDEYEVELTVWATTPSPSAWQRAVEQSRQLRETFLKRLGADPSLRMRLTAVGRPWMSGSVKRPTSSVTVKLRAAGDEWVPSL